MAFSFRMANLDSDQPQDAISNEPYRHWSVFCKGHWCEDHKTAIVALCTQLDEEGGCDMVKWQIGAMKLSFILDRCEDCAIICNHIYKGLSADE